MTGRKRCLSVIAGILAALIGAGQSLACGEVVEFLPGGEEKRLFSYDAAPPFVRLRLASISAPSKDVSAFLRYVQATYRPKSRLGIYGLQVADMAKLFGYALGEAASHSAPVDVFSPQFREELEVWIVRFSVHAQFVLGGAGPADGNGMWRLIEEGARGFYDEEMAAAFGSVVADDGPTSIEQWFKSLSSEEKERFLARAFAAGLVKAEGVAYSASEFELIAILMDGELAHEGLPDDVRRARIRDLAAGKFNSSTGE